MTEKVFMAGMYSLWCQPFGPDTQPQYLGCHTVGDIAEPLGDVTLTTQPDRARTGYFKPKLTYRGAKGLVTTTIDTDLRNVPDWLEQLSCPFSLHVHKVACGRRDVFSNFDRSYMLNRARVTTRTVSGLGVMSQSNEAESSQKFAISAESLGRNFPLRLSQVSVTETESFTGLYVAGDFVCADICGTAQNPQDLIFTSAKALLGSSASKANVGLLRLQTSYAITNAQPFAHSIDINGLFGYRVNNSVYRIFTCVGTTGAGALQIAYSDDMGATWTAVTVGAKNGEYVYGPHAFCALDRYHIWLGTSKGDIYFSNDGGMTWTLQYDGSGGTKKIVAVDFSDNFNGFAVFDDANVIRSVDGVNWTAMTQVANASVASDLSTHSDLTAWVSASTGLYVTHDGGITWTKRLSVNIATIDWLDDMTGLAAGGVVNGLIYQTIDGGFDWFPLDLLTNAGWSDIEFIDTMTAYAVGPASGVTGMLARLSPRT